MQLPGHCGRESFKRKPVTSVRAEQDSELCTMADFSKRVPLDELRGRGLMKGLQPEVLEQISRGRGCEACTQLIAYTDGSACMTRAIEHGPYRGRGHPVLCVSALTRSACQASLPLVVLCDANARVGSVESLEGDLCRR